MRKQIFRAGRFLGDELVLEDLVLVTTEAGFFVGHAGQRVAVFAHRLADGGDDVIALFQAKLVVLAEGDAGGFDGFVDGVEDADVA